MRPVENAYAGTYWSAAREHRLEIGRCTDCGRWVHYPKDWCPACRTRTITPEPVAGGGTVVSFTLTHRPPVPVADEDLPVAHVLVELDEQPGLRVAATMVDGEPAIGARVRVVFEDHDGYTLPQFELASD